MILSSTSTRDDTECRVRRSIDKLRERDEHLLDVDANERSITHHLAVYLQQEFQNWNVDVEYNRSRRDAKRLSIPEELSSEAEKDNVSRKDTDAVTVYPDIIVHRRGTNDDNFLVIEVKKRRSGHELDEKKLVEFTKPLGENGFDYRWGLQLTLDCDAEREDSLSWYECGRRSRR